jgi:hypothetical protein
VPRHDEERDVPPPDTEDLSPLIRGQLNSMKVPPYPPKRISRKVTGVSSERILHQIWKKSITKRLTRGEKRRLGGVVEATNGSSSRRFSRQFVTHLGVGKRPPIPYNQGEDATRLCCA